LSGYEEAFELRPPCNMMRSKNLILNTKKLLSCDMMRSKNLISTAKKLLSCDMMRSKNLISTAKKLLSYDICSHKSVCLFACLYAGTFIHTYM